MKVYTYSEARQRLASVLEEAAREGKVRIQRKDGQAFVIRPEQRAASPLDVEGLDLDLSADEIVQMVKEGRRTEYQTAADWRAYIAVRSDGLRSDGIAPEGGEAYIRGTDITVASILDDLAASPGPDEIVRRRPGLTREAVEAAIRYAAEQVRRLY